MASTAISSQGTVIKIGTGSGSAKNISGVGVGNPTILTSNAHGLNNGDVVDLESVGGINAVNGKSLQVLFKTTNTFAVAADSTGQTYTTGGTATPTTFTKLANCKAFNGLDGQASEQDVSNFDSTGKEFVLGLFDGGQITIDVDCDDTDPGQLAALTNQQNSTIRAFQIILPNGKTISFNAFVKKFTRSGGVDKSYSGQLSLRLSGGYQIA